MAVTNRQAVSGTMAPHSTAPMSMMWSTACPFTIGKYGLGRPLSFDRTHRAPACRLWIKTPGDWGGGKVPLTCWVAWTSASADRYHIGGTQELGIGCASLVLHLHLRGASGTVST